MKTVPGQLPRLSRKKLRRAAKAGELDGLRVRVAEAEETIRAISTGEVDAVVITRNRGSKAFTLEGIDQAYRELIETMNEGALTLTSDKIILYANQYFARMVKCPLEQVTGSSFRRFLSLEDQAVLRALPKKTGNAGSKIRVLLKAGDGSRLSVQISLRWLSESGSARTTIGMVVTDLTESRRAEERLRALTQRVVQVQESERGRVALELHDNITQLLCAVLFRSQALADKIPERERALKSAALKLCAMVGRAAGEVERISRNLRPGVLAELGLVAVLRSASEEFADRTGVAVKLACVELTLRLSADSELALFRILQEALTNVGKHARARCVLVSLTQQDDSLQLAIKDDGAGFDLDRSATTRRRKSGLGLLSMRERASYVGGELKIKSSPGGGTEIEVRLPLPKNAPLGGDSLGGSVPPR